MSKKNIECEYCHTLISEDDIKCPECGANCSNVIKKYRAEQEKKEAEERQKREEQGKAVFDNVNQAFKTTKIVSTVFIIIFACVFLFIITNAFNQIRRNNESRKDNNTVVNKDDDTDKKDEKVTVGYQETAETSSLKITLDDYELYEYHSNNFENRNTPKGYQKIAFHFTVENKSEREISTYSLVELTADDYKVETSRLEQSPGFEEVVSGKAKYEALAGSYLGSGKTLKGYVGYLVPTDKKVLKFYIGEDITIEIENPAFEG